MERLNKFLAHAGVGSRRHCDDLIAAGRVKVNGRKVVDLGLKIDPASHDVSVDDHPVKTERPVYWAVNKPVGYLCTNDDPDGRPRAVELLPHVEQRVYTVGRLDEASEGLLLMTNDGELAHALTHPRFSIPKTYLVLVAGKPGPDDLQKLLDGVWLSDGKVRASDVRRLKPQGDSTWLRIVLTEGKNREIRRMLAEQGHKVLKLRRVAIGPVKLDKLAKGKARRVSEPELVELRRWVALASERIAKLKEKAAKAIPDGMKLTPRPKPTGPRPGAAFKPAGPRPGAAFKPAGPRPGGAFRPAAPKPGAAPQPAGPRPGGAFKPAGPKPSAAGKPVAAKPGAAFKPAGPRPGPARSPARPKGWRPLPKSR
ncbi:pseudouridine synthase [Urbifossiella limnaea]|uniref:Pseudouridine synthase n=1 Tax=Urbifossiella limnaea TaxID=2528023 RepID=A0A517Y1I4_9BACT|nr:pseudouridine synthase [Urbifossiella limnaea]QDU23626.1 Ribosomal large subunit pseudouridine synthase B [Urbifossiella limnaea]